MKVTVAMISWEEVDLIGALNSHHFFWDYEIITGVYGETYFPAERDDIFLEISQETLNRYDGSIDQHRLVWLECSSLLSSGNFNLQNNPSRDVVLKYIKDNIDRVIDIDETGGDW